MNFRPCSSLARNSTRGFTLIEILVAVAVLALVLIMMLQITSGILSSTRVQNQQMDSVAAARRALDVIEADVRKAIINQDATVLLPQDETGLALLAQRRGPQGATAHRFLAVRYRTNSDAHLTRAYSSLSYNGTDLLNFPATFQGSNNLISPGILGFQVRVVTASTNHPPNSPSTNNWATTRYGNRDVESGWRALVTAAAPGADNLTNRAQSLRIWLAAADEQTMSLLDSTGSLGTVRNLLSATANPADWRYALDTDPNIPPPAKSAIRVLQKTIPVP